MSARPLDHVNQSRRGFLQGMAGILAAGVAPAAIGSNILMPVRKIWTTSGTFKNFTVPAGVRRVILTFAGCSIDGEGSYLVQLGSASEVEDSGYCAMATSDTGANRVGSTTGFPMKGNGSVRLEMAGDDVWVASGMSHADDHLTVMAGSKGLSGSLNKLLVKGDGRGEIVVQYEDEFLRPRIIRT